MRADKHAGIESDRMRGKQTYKQMAKQTAKQPTTEMRLEQLRPHSVRLSLSLSLSFSLTLCISLPLCLRTHLPLSLSVRRDSQDKERSWATFQEEGAQGCTQRRDKATQTSKQYQVISPSSQPTIWATNQIIIVLSLSHSLLLCAGNIHEVRHGRRQASNQETARRPVSHLATQTSS